MTHRHPVRVYYEDTDLAGIVYYANYLKFIERARTEWVRAAGIDQAVLRETQGIVFAVRRVEADYLRPVRFGEDLTVETRADLFGGARIVLAQDILRAGERVFASVVTLVCMDASGHAARIPAEVRAALAPQVH
jgi:acyl-CoA thioester hydrolase